MTEEELDYIADEQGGMTRANWCTEYLNVWPDEEALVRWVSAEAWTAAEADGMTPIPEVVGADIDLSTGEAAWATAGRAGQEVHLVATNYTPYGGIAWLAKELEGLPAVGIGTSRLTGLDDRLELITQADELRASTAFSAGITTGRIRQHIGDTDAARAVVGCRPDYVPGGAKVLDQPAVGAIVLATWQLTRSPAARPFLDLVT